MKTMILLLCCTLILSGCNFKPQQENKNKPLSDLSIYNLPAKWTNQNGENMELKDLRGHVLVMVMIYTSCKTACPRLVADMKNIAGKIPDKYKHKVKLVLVSIDPEVDTPKRLKEFSIENKMTDNHWVFLRSTEENTREFAAVLAVNYKKISPIEFSHSNIISLFNSEGELIFQQEGLGINYDTTVEQITAAAKLE